MKVLITGASSLIGSGLTDALTRRGDSVVCFQRRSSGIPDADRGVTEVLGDVRDADAVGAAAVGCDAVVHLAAKVGVVGGWEEYRSINVDGTSNVLAAARRAGVGRFVHVSSPSVAHGGEALIGAGAEPPVLGRHRAYYAESKAIAENDGAGRVDRGVGRRRDPAAPRVGSG